MNYFVTPPERSDWKLSPVDFVRELRGRWPTTKIQEIAEPADSESLTFETPMPHGTVTGAFSRTGRTLIIEYGDLHDICALACWFRSITPPSQPLVFCDEAGNGYTELTASSTEADLLRAFGIE